MPAALVVEDDASLGALLCRVMKKNGVHAISVPSAEDAILELSRRAFDFVLLDLMLPASSGFYVVESVRRMESSRRPTVVVMTAARGAILDKVDRSIVKAVLFKPLEVEAVVSFLRALDHP